MKNKFKIKSKKLRNSIQNLKFWWFKVYIFLILAVSLSLIGLYILAAVEETPSALKDWLAGKVKIGEQLVVCPDFVDVDMNDLTMKDQCTGLIWARHELPSYKSAGDTTPGYTWDEANESCTALAGGFRLPTVEELMSLIHYRCDDTTCFATAEIASINGVAPVLSNGIYWASNDFHESPDWTDPTATPPGTPERDYKRSVNLLNGEVDSPVFGKTMRLNAWCVMAGNPEIVEKKFTSVTPGAITNGQKATSGQLKTIYHRECADASECSIIGATDCEGGGGEINVTSCGDGSCDAPETCSSCPADCRACPPAIIPLSVNITSPTGDQQFTQGTNTISICYSISDSSLLTNLLVKFDNSEVLNVSSGFSLNPPGANYSACIGANTISNIPGQHTLKVIATDSQGTVEKSVNINVVPSATSNCTNTTPPNASLCPGDATGLSANTDKTVVVSCSSPAGSIPKCEYTCDTNFVYVNGNCIVPPSMWITSSDGQDVFNVYLQKSGSTSQNLGTATQTPLKVNFTEAGSYTLKIVYYYNSARNNDESQSAIAIQTASSQYLAVNSFSTPYHSANDECTQAGLNYTCNLKAPLCEQYPIKCEEHKPGTAIFNLTVNFGT